MTPFLFTFTVFVVSVAAGVLGALLGLGGGIIIVPALTIFFGVDIRFAIGASIVSVIATSSGAAASYVRERMTNLRVAMFLEMATTAGALCGAYLAGVMRARWLFAIFGLALGYSAVAMLFHLHERSGLDVPADPLADRLRLHDAFYDEALGKEVVYKVTHTKLGFFFMYLAGIASGLLGIGSGIFKVPTMDLAMRLPIKVSSATSNFMIGVTAAASAGVYFMRGDINPFIAAPVAVGVLVGATAGSRLLARIQGGLIKKIFVVVLLATAAQMLIKGLRG